MQTKVTQTKIFRKEAASVTLQGGERTDIAYLDVLVAEGELVLVIAVDRMYVHTKLSKNSVIMGALPYLPIIISKTEKIEVGDKVLKYNKISTVISGEEYEAEKPIGSGTFRKEEWCTIQVATTNKYPKVLVFSEQFSPKQLQMIVDGEIKDEDKILVECYKYNEFKGGTGEQSGYYVNSNSENHVTLHKVEEKVYTREEVLNILSAFFDQHVNAQNADIDGWFKQNIK